jgi:ubiquinone/menaquinone biosynthesis C-methylase UbiE
MDDLLELTSRVEATHFWFRGFRHFVSPALDNIAHGRRDLTMLDCGCGTGYNAATLLHPHGRVFGFDLTPAGLAHARQTGVPVVRADMHAIPFASGQFDLATSFDVFQYVADDHAVMREIARVIRPGGALVVTASALNVLRGGHAGTWPEIRRYTMTSMRVAVEAAGLRVVQMTYLFATLFPALLAARAVNRGATGDDWEMKIPAAPVNATLTAMLGMEAAISRHVPMPFGSSVLVVARKPA